ncbi:nucleotide sugar dehydrogenase [Listeria kieliensis]|uniref:UDP-N-acetyl-D-mannosamine dehydrogenase n=1 Tax=Listeria kieliensis TaxID=1621700 RepID=A0A3D8TSU2_9LIST|nr:nucleotide sugar dehydrogenase [Listeria kieliensis]RDX00846.1 UDP-N-acetyl-D-mannosamine dehydrogenase [Listeria kieliensis]
MKIEVMGLGYIGLPTAIMFAKHGHEVTGVDVVQEVVTTLNNGKIHIEEPGLEAELGRVLETGRFKVQMQVEQADVFIVAVPTPNLDDAFKSCDLTYVEQAMGMIIPHLERGNTIIIESTIAPRTTDTILASKIKQAGFEVGKDIFLVHCPERVLPGNILHELKWNNRIIGGVTKACTLKGVEIYGSFVEGKLLETSAAVAELSKLIENTYRDVNIALANEIVRIGDVLGIDSLEVIRLANYHPRVNIHQPGPGVGGHCLAVDPYFIISEASEETALIQMARQINERTPVFLAQKVRALMKKLGGKKITICGIAYKGNVDDVRESPALKVLDELKKDFEICVHDPHVKRFDWIERDLTRAAQDSDLLLVLTDHDDYQVILEDVFQVMQQRVVFDTKGVVSQTNDRVDYLTLGDLSKIKSHEEKAKI